MYLNVPNVWIKMLGMAACTEAPPFGDNITLDVADFILPEVQQASTGLRTEAGEKYNNLHTISLLKTERWCFLIGAESSQVVLDH